MLKRPCHGRCTAVTTIHRTVQSNEKLLSLESATVTGGPDQISEDAWNAWHRNAGPDVYATAVRRVREGDALTYPAREVLGISD